MTHPIAEWSTVGYSLGDWSMSRDATVGLSKEIRGTVVLEQFDAAAIARLFGVPLAMLSRPAAFAVSDRLRRMHQQYRAKRRHRR